MIDLFGTGLQGEAIRAIFDQLESDRQDAILQRTYDAGYSGTRIGRLFDVANVYARIDAHRGRGRSQPIATAI